MRSALNGRHAASGCSLSMASTRIDSQARMQPTVSGASAPPASMTSARPLRIASKACPMACTLDEQAETTAYAIPFAP